MTTGFPSRSRHSRCAGAAVQRDRDEIGSITTRASWLGIARATPAGSWQEIPGIGPIVATALVAEIGDWKAFASGRNLAAWIGLVPKQHTTGGKDRLGSITTKQNFVDTAAMVAGGRRDGRDPLCTEARNQEPTVARTINGAPTGQGSGGRASPQQNRADGLGHHSSRRRDPRGTEIVDGGIRDASEDSNTNWRGHDDVMQIRSFRGSGEPAWVTAYSNACLRLGPDPRRALGPAATPATSTGRTRDRTPTNAAETSEGIFLCEARGQSNCQEPNTTGRGWNV